MTLSRNSRLLFSTSANAWLIASKIAARISEKVIKARKGWLFSNNDPIPLTDISKKDSANPKAYLKRVFTVCFFVCRALLKDGLGNVHALPAAVVDVGAVAAKQTLIKEQRGIAGHTLQQNGGAIVHELIARVGVVAYDAADGVEVEAGGVVLKPAVLGVDPGLPVGQHAGLPS